MVYLVDFYGKNVFFYLYYLRCLKFYDKLVKWYKYIMKNYFIDFEVVVVFIGLKVVLEFDDNYKLFSDIFEIWLVCFVNIS